MTIDLKLLGNFKNRLILKAFNTRNTVYIIASLFRADDEST